MHQIYLQYIIVEAFCILFTATIYAHLRSEVGRERELASLKYMIASYIILVATDIPWAGVEGGIIRIGHTANALFNAASIASVVPGCFFWMCFVEARISPEKVWQKKTMLLIAAPAAAMVAIDLVSAFTGWVFYIDDQAHFTTGSLFWLQSTVTSVYLLIPTFHSLYEAFRTKSGKKRWEYLSYVAYMLGCYGIVAVEDSLKTIPLLELGILAVIIHLFLTIYLDSEYELAQKEREQTETSTAVMLSQLQPHFLFNALMAIQDKCHDKAPEAEEMVVEFAEYLRGNLDSLRRTEPVPFQMELGHTQNYLALENKRFPGKIRVEYFIEAEDFLIPSLTLQPVVENAVRYGVTQREDGGIVKIISRDAGKYYEIVVEDDGVGFDIDATKPDGRTHLGMDRIRKRLEDMCGGSLAAKSTPDVGTTVRITIPKRGDTAV